MNIALEVFYLEFLPISLTTFEAMLYTEIKLPTFVQANNGADRKSVV